MLSVMCGRSTYKLTWEEIVRLYRLTSDQPPQNTRARYNVCPTTTIDTIIGQDGNRRLVPMRWGLVPSWWSKSLKFKRTRCLIPVSGYYASGRTRRAENSRGISPPVMARRHLQLPDYGMNGKIQRQASDSNPAP